MTMSEQTNVVVIGGGYAGVIAANHLRTNPDVAVTLINPRPVFVERIRLVVDSAVRIDAPARTVALASGDTVRYDYLIYAVGSTGAAPTVPGAAEFAHALSEFEHGEPLRAAVAGIRRGEPVIVVGAGP